MVNFAGVGTNIDFSKYTPAQLEAMGRLAFANNRVEAFLPYMVGSFMDALILGIIAVVWCVWFVKARPTERTWIKYTVYWLGFAVIGTSVVTQGSTADTFIEYFGQYKVFFDVTWYKWHGIGTAASRIPPSIFYLHRAYHLIGKRIWIIIVVAPMIAMLLIVSLLPIALLKSLPYSYTLQVFIITGAACDVASDLVLTSTIAIQLYRSRTGWRGTDRLIFRLIVMIAECQAPTTLMSIIFLLFWTITPNSTALVSMIFISKIHVLSMLIALLSRVVIQKEQQEAGSSANYQSKSMSTGMSSNDSHLKGAEANRLAYGRKSESRTGGWSGSMSTAEEGLLGKMTITKDGFEELGDPAGSRSRLVKD